MPNFAFNPAAAKPFNNFEPLPAGWYPVVIEASEIIPTAAKNGFRLMLTFLVIDGQHKGRKVTQGYNIDNPNPQAVEIAQSEIQGICSCVGKFNPIQASEELHNIPFQVRFAKQKDSDYNEAKGYKDAQGNDPGKGGAGAQVGHQTIPQAGFASVPAQPPYGAPPAPVQEQLSPDGQWKLVNGQWVANTPPPPPPVQQAPPAWAPPGAGGPPPPQQPAYTQQPPQTQAAPPAWTPGNMPAPPAWAPPATR